MDTNEFKSIIISKFGSQKNFAEAIGWTENKVSAIIKHKYVPDLEEAELAGDLLCTSLDQFVNIFLPKMSRK
ncbi:MAG: helix-turn-helix transcriptional regulator [Oscillospiraceae bacterium]|nr:helix-turn-helix transcriptional regulator [Oscillospiraceae bacterium]